MPGSPNGAAAREIIIPSRAGKMSESTPPTQSQKWRFWTGVCFAIVLLVVFARPLLMLTSYVAGSQLHSYILLVPFVSAYLLYIRRNQLPKNYTTDLPLTIVSLAAGLGLLAFTYLLDFAGRAPANNDRIVLLTLSFLCCLAAGGFSFSDVPGCERQLSLGLPHFHGADAGRDGRCARNSFKICRGRSSQLSFPP